MTHKIRISSSSNIKAKTADNGETQIQPVQQVLPQAPPTPWPCRPRGRRQLAGCWTGRSQSRGCCPVCRGVDLVIKNSGGKLLCIFKTDLHPVDEGGVDSISQPPRFWCLEDNKLATRTWNKNDSMNKMLKVNLREGSPPCRCWPWSGRTQMRSTCSSSSSSQTSPTWPSLFPWSAWTWWCVRTCDLFSYVIWGSAFA